MEEKKQLYQKIMYRLFRVSVTRILSLHEEVRALERQILQLPCVDTALYHEISVKRDRALVRLIALKKRTCQYYEVCQPFIDYVREQSEDMVDVIYGEMVKHAQHLSYLDHKMNDAYVHNGFTDISSYSDQHIDFMFDEFATVLDDL